MIVRTGFRKDNLPGQSWSVLFETALHACDCKSIFVKNPYYDLGAAAKFVEIDIAESA